MNIEEGCSRAILIRVGSDKKTRRRSRSDMYIDVLWAIKNGDRKPTRIMYEANMSWVSLQRMLKSLILQGLVREVDTRGIGDRCSYSYYRLTQKGENVVRYFRDTPNLLKGDLAMRTKALGGEV